MSSQVSANLGCFKVTYSYQPDLTYEEVVHFRFGLKIRL